MRTLTSEQGTQQEDMMSSSAGRSPTESAIPELQSPFLRNKNTYIPDDHHDFASALAPARIDEVVRAPPARDSQSLRLSPLPQARSLQDWEVEDFILVATIDGSLHALDRTCGKERWVLGNPESPMIKTFHHRQNRSQIDQPDPEEDFVFVVEPSLGGSLYIQHKDPSIGLQSLDMTVKSLVDRSPHLTRDPPLAFVASKDASMYTIDAVTGTVKDFIDTTASYFSDDSSKGICRKLSGFEIDEQGCEPAGVLHVGRTTYTAVISDGLTRKKICTIQYSEWTPNNGDFDLQSQYNMPFDRLHIHTFHDGHFIGLEGVDQDRRAKFHGKFGSPAARVWDVARPSDDAAIESSLIMLASPANPANFQGSSYNSRPYDDKVFINKTEAGWFALSELRYPGVTSQAGRAKVDTTVSSGFESIGLEENFDRYVGFHHTNVVGSRNTGPLTISGPRDTSDLGIREAQGMALDATLMSRPLLSSTISKESALVFFIATVLFGLALAKQKKIRLQRLDTQRVSLNQNEADLRSRDQALLSSNSESRPSLPSESSGSPLPQVNIPQTDMSLGTSSPVPPSMTHARQVSNTVQEVDQGSGSDSEEGLSELKNSEDVPISKKKTKRGKRGARKGKRGAKKSMNPESMEDLALVPEVTQKDGELVVGRLRINTTVCLGNGSSGTTVFPGSIDGRDVAVKRIVRSTHSLAAKEIKHLLSSDENAHVVRYMGKEESTNFTYIALDRFTASLDQVVERPEKYPMLVMPPKGLDVKDALRQITDGVQHLHSLKLVHRDIKPQNVLVRSVKSNRPVVGRPKLQFVITDFGLCRTLEDGPNSTYAPTANHTAAGTSGWRAPELLANSKNMADVPVVSRPDDVKTEEGSASKSHSSDCVVVDPPTGRRATKAIDIFSLGCVFFYIMTQGRHPFDVGGESLGRDLNIKENRSDLGVLRLYDYSFEADDLIMQMINHQPSNRPDTSTILLHPYFWDVEVKLDFLCELSDRFEHEKLHPTTTTTTSSSSLLSSPSSISSSPSSPPPAPAPGVASTTSTSGVVSSPLLTALESQSPNVIGPTNDFLKALPRNFLTEMGKQRKYTGSRMLDLLRVIRNKKNHFHDLPENVRRDLMDGGTSEGYFRFWSQRFPSLLVVCHALVLELGVVQAWRLERFFSIRCEGQG